MSENQIPPKELERIQRRLVLQMETAENLKGLEDTLITDVWFMDAALRREDVQEMRRAFIRCVMAYVEGASFAMRELLLISDEFDNLDAIHQTFLKNEELQLGDTGIIETKNRRGYHSSAPLLLLTLRCCALSVKAAIDFGVGKAGWQAVRETFKLRDQLMHPKVPESLEVTDAQLLDARRAFNWYVASEWEINDARAARLLRSVRDLVAQGSFPQTELDKYLATRKTHLNNRRNLLLQVDKL